MIRKCREWKLLMADCDVPGRCFPGGMRDQRPDQSHYVPELLNYAEKRVQMEVCATWQHPTVRLDDVKSKLSFGSVCLKPGREAFTVCKSIHHIYAKAAKEKIRIVSVSRETRLNHNI